MEIDHSVWTNDLMIRLLAATYMFLGSVQRADCWARLE